MLNLFLSSCVEIQKLHSPEIMKNNPPKINAIVVPTDPETGVPSSVARFSVLASAVASAESVASVSASLVASGSAVATSSSSSSIGYGFPEP